MEPAARWVVGTSPTMTTVGFGVSQNTATIYLLTAASTVARFAVVA